MRQGRDLMSSWSIASLRIGGLSPLISIEPSLPLKSTYCQSCSLRVHAGVESVAPPPPGHDSTGLAELLHATHPVFK